MTPGSTSTTRWRMVTEQTRQRYAALAPGADPALSARFERQSGAATQRDRHHALAREAGAGRALTGVRRR